MRVNGDRSTSKQFIVISLFLIFTDAAMANSEATTVRVEASATGVSLFAETSNWLVGPDLIFIDASGQALSAWLASSTALEADEERHFSGVLRGWVGIEFYVVPRVVTSWRDAEALANRAYFYCTAKSCVPSTWTAFAIGTGHVVASNGPDGPELLSSLRIGVAQ